MFLIQERKGKLLLILAMLIFLTCIWADFGQAEVNNSSPTPFEIAEYSSKNPSGRFSHDYKGSPLWNKEVIFQVQPNLTLPYSPGVLSESEQIKGLNTLKTVRYMAGLSDDIYLSDVMGQYAQAACLINYINGIVSHNPVIPKGLDPNLANLGQVGSRVSNLARVPYVNANLKWSIVHGWMDDSGASNIKVLGHRRWILNPKMNMTGFGSIISPKGTYSAMYAIDSYDVISENKVIKWPCENMPVDYFNPKSPWSVIIGEKISKRDVIATLTRVSDGKTWTFNCYKSQGDFYVDNNKYGTGSCIIFRPNSLKKIKADDTFIIVILYGNKKISYNVKFFDLEHYFSPKKPVCPELSYFNQDCVSVSWNKVPEAESYSVYRKTYKGSWKLLTDDLDDTYYNDYSYKPGLKYYYRVTAGKKYNKEIYESFPSKMHSIIIPLGNLELDYEMVNGSPSLSWSYVSKATGYKVYKKINGYWKLVTTTKKLYYPIKEYKKSSYRVRAYRTYKGYTVYSKYAYI